MDKNISRNKDYFFLSNIMMDRNVLINRDVFFFYFNGYMNFNNQRLIFRYFMDRNILINKASLFFTLWVRIFEYTKISFSLLYG